MLVTVKYLGKRLPITLSMPWLDKTVGHVTFGGDRLSQMAGEDAVKLCSDCPRDFQIVNEEADSVVVEERIEQIITTKPASTHKKRRSRKKE